MRDLIYSREFIYKTMNVIIDKKIKFICKERGKNKFSKPNPIIYVSENEKSIYSYVRTKGYNTAFTVCSPRAAQFVYAYLTGKEAKLSNIDKNYHSEFEEVFVICTDSIPKKINKLLEI